MRHLNLDNGAWEELLSEILVRVADYFGRLGGKFRIVFVSVEDVDHNEHLVLGDSLLQTIICRICQWRCIALNS